MAKKVNVTKETFNLEEGEYSGTIKGMIYYDNDDEAKVMIKIGLEDGTTFLNCIPEEWLGEYPFSKLFMELDTDDPDKLIDQKVKFEVKNKTSENGLTFSNIKKIELDI